jgi:hypothetical protein
MRYARAERRVAMSYAPFLWVSQKKAAGITEICKKINRFIFFVPS